MTKQKSSTWFTVDKEGLRALRENADPAALIYEVVQNAWDEPITEVKVSLTVFSRGVAMLSAEDDSPNGFANLSHAFTLFAPSYKKAHAEKRGRFNVGEKMVLALAEAATIETTTGTVTFHADGTRDVNTDARREAGTLFNARLRLTKAQVEAALTGARAMIPPPGKRTFINGIEVGQRAPIRVLTVSALPTVVEALDGSGFGTSPRATTIEVYEPLPGEQASIYEMGIPVVATGDRWTANIMQKVPLNMDRDNVTPGYLRRIRQELLEGMIEQVKGDEAATTWVKEAVAATDKPEVVAAVIQERFGDKVVAYDPSDVEGTKRAVSEGYTVVSSRTLGAAEWASVRSASLSLGHALIPAAGQVTPSNSTIELSADGKPPIPEADWTPGMVLVCRYAKEAAAALMGLDIEVLMTNNATGGYLAAYGHRTLRLNVGTLGHRWFTEPDQEKIDTLLIHEFAHEVTLGPGWDDHLSHAYHEQGFRLGAKMAALARVGKMPALEPMA